MEAAPPFPNDIFADDTTHYQAPKLSADSLPLPPSLAPLTIYLLSTPNPIPTEIFNQHIRDRTRAPATLGGNGFPATRTALSS